MKKRWIYGILVLGLLTVGGVFLPFRCEKTNREPPSTEPQTPHASKPESTPKVLIAPPHRLITREYMGWVLERFDQFVFQLWISAGITDHGANNGKHITFDIPYRGTIGPEGNYNDRVLLRIVCQTLYDDYDAKSREAMDSRVNPEDPDVVLMGTEYVDRVRQYVQKAYDYDFSSIQPSFDLWQLGYDEEKWNWGWRLPRPEVPGAVDEFLSLTSGYTHIDIGLHIHPDCDTLGLPWEETYWEDKTLTLLTTPGNLGEGGNAKFMELFNILEPFVTAAKNYCNWQ